MNLTLAVDAAAVERAREVARQQGTSLNALLRDYIEFLAGQSSGAEILAELQGLWRERHPGSGGYTFRRDDVYASRVGERRGKPRVR